MSSQKMVMSAIEAYPIIGCTPGAESWSNLDNKIRV